MAVHPGLFAAETGAQAGLAKLFGPGESGMGSCASACSGGSSLLVSLDFDSLSGGAPTGLRVVAIPWTAVSRLTLSAAPTFGLPAKVPVGMGSPLDQASRVVEVGARDLAGP